MEGLTVFEQIKLFVFLIPFILLCIACYKLALPHKRRGRQVLMPVLAILLSIYAIFKIQQFTSELHAYLEYVFSLIDHPEQALPENQAVNEAVNQLIDGAVGSSGGGNEVSEAIKKQFADIEIPPSVRSNLARLRSFLGDAFDLNLLIAYIVNFAAIMAFMIIKGILLPILSRVWSNDELMKLTASRWYDFHELPPGYYKRHENANKDKGQKDAKNNSNAKNNSKKKNKKEADNDDELSGWFVKPQTTSYHKLLLAAYVGVFVAVSLVFLVSVFHPDWAFFKASFYPVFIIIVFGEVVAFLDGLVFVEEPVEIKVEEPKREIRDPKYRKIWEEFRNIYPDNILRRTPDILEDTCLPDPPVIDKDLSFLTQSDDENLKTVAMLFEHLDDQEFEPSYVEGCLRLLQGKSTLFCNPFYEDLDRYLFPPIIYNLLSYKKCLFIMGRDSTAEDFCAWLKKGIKDFVGADGLWQTEIISEAPINFDLGILKFSDIYNLKVLNTHREFFSEVRFVFILEPSKILATGQLALSLIINQLALDQCDAITYCACDHNCDGLVDCLSHALKTSMTHVIATLPGNGSNLQVFWDADSQNMQYKILDNVTHYLGIGTEISLIGMRYGVCNSGAAWGNDIAHQNECWFSCDKFPIMDMMWIAGQYYNQICQYIRKPIGQEQFNKALEVRANIWHCPKAESTYLIVEDEYNNLFEMSRIFSSRSLKEGFINVISGHYLLRDYMIEYIDLFQSDAKAIPTVVPDYARTERNVILKLLMMMTARPLSEDFVRQELRQAGLIETVKADLDTNRLKNKAKKSNELFQKFNKKIEEHLLIPPEDNGLTLDIKEKTSDDGFTVEKEYFYIIKPGDNPINCYLKNLTNAYFISEDEAENKHFISAKLYGHVLQSYLPGQFITLDGKYYQVMSISDKNGITLRRAADHIHKRLYYRQVRDILLKEWVFDGSMGACQHITFTSGMQMEIARGFANYDVKAPGYLECAPYNDIKHARYFELNKIYDDTFVYSEPLELRESPSIRAKVITKIEVKIDENKKKIANQFSIIDRYHGWYKTEYKGQTGWIYPKNELDRSYSHKTALRLRLPQIARNVIDYKLEDIENCARAEAEAVQRECAAVDQKAEEEIAKKSHEIRNKEKFDQIQDDAFIQADNAKKIIREKAVANQAACLKLRDALKNCQFNEEREERRLASDPVQATKPLTSDEQIKKDEDYLTEVFLSLNKPEIIERVRFTLCLMLSEIFKTTYPEAWQYINVVTEVDPELLTGNLKYANYHLIDESKTKQTKAENVEAQGDNTTVAAEVKPSLLQEPQSVERAVEPKETLSESAEATIETDAEQTPDEADAHAAAMDPSMAAEKDAQSSVSSEELNKALAEWSTASEESTEPNVSDFDLGLLDNIESAQAVIDAQEDSANASADSDAAENKPRKYKSAIEAVLAHPNIQLADLYAKLPPANGKLRELKVSPTGTLNIMQDGQKVLISDENVDELLKAAKPKEPGTIELKMEDMNSSDSSGSEPDATEGVASDNPSVAKDVAGSKSVVSSEQTQTVSCPGENGVAEGAANAACEADTSNANSNQQGYIYVLEDSEIDLGLTVSVERYLDKYLEIIYDVLVWHSQKMKAGLEPAQNADSATDFEINLNVEDDVPDATSDEKPKGLFARFIEWLKKLFESKKPASAEQPQDTTDPADVIHEDKPLQKPLRNYIDQCFLKYGDTKYDKALAIKETIAYLGLLGYDSNRFDKARFKAQETRNKKEADAKEKCGDESSGK
ncbi:MAG: hypothetical protein J6A01_08640 [Proteobacteria bacterium]|nr:hypothetical protein [Pseudomonadota bacterium]